MTYVDGYILPVPRGKLTEYKRLAAKAGKIWKDHGALDYKECVADDIDKEGFSPFSKVAKAKPGETVVFSFVVFKSRRHRDTVNAKVMKDPRIQGMCDSKKMPFDVKRMAYGGFKVLVDPK